VSFSGDHGIGTFPLCLGHAGTQAAGLFAIREIARGHEGIGDRGEEDY
jgi:hypothetical protein